MADEWHRVEEIDLPDDGPVRSAVIDGRSVALARCGATFGALENRCPHQGGPLGEGAVERGWLRCPWHGYDYDPITGRPPEGFSDAPRAFEVEERDDGVYVRLPEQQVDRRTVADVLVETLVNFGVTHVFGMVGHSNLGFADVLRRAEQRGDLTFIGIRHEGAAAFAASAYGKLTGRPAACFAIAGLGSTNLLTASTTPNSTVPRSSRSRARSRQRCAAAAPSRTSTSQPCSTTSRFPATPSSGRATMPSWQLSRSSTPSMAAASRISFCRTKCRCNQATHPRRNRVVGSLCVEQDAELL